MSAMKFVGHDLDARSVDGGKVRYETVALREPGGAEVAGLHTVRITLDNPAQLNSYTTEMVKDVILACPYCGKIVGVTSA